MWTKQPYLDVVEWAQSVGSDEPHGPRDVEDVLLRNHPANQQRLSPERTRGKYDVVLGTLAMIYVFAAFAPLFGPILFLGGYYKGRSIDPTGVSDALLWSAIAFGFAAVFYVGQLVGWWRARYRSVGIIAMAGLAIGCGYLTLSAANDGLDRFYGDPTIFLVPIWATILLAAVTILVHAVSPKSPDRMGTKNLTEESRALLVSERGEALEVLAERGMLEGCGVATLNARSLGELHVPGDR